MALSSFLVACALAVVARAVPTTLETRQAITTLSASQIAVFKPYTNYASAAYCPATQTATWSCGPCAANPGFKPIASGGDGEDVQNWYVGFDGSLGTIVVGFQGTNTSAIESIASDADAILAPLDPTLFPGVSSDVKAHSGFQESHTDSATMVLAAVQKGISQFSAKEVTVVGHSLGGAIAVLSSIYLPLHVTGVTFQTFTYGLPRVGNPAFANYVDAHATLTHINNKEDFIPIIPGRGLGYQHANGEVHIMDNNQWVSCPGHDNTSNECSTGDVQNIFEGDESEHDGPYDGVVMGCD